MKVEKKSHAGTHTEEEDIFIDGFNAACDAWEAYIKASVPSVSEISNELFQVTVKWVKNNKEDSPTLNDYAQAIHNLLTAKREKDDGK